MPEIVIRIQIPEGSSVGVAVPQLQAAEHPAASAELVQQVFPGSQPTQQPTTSQATTAPACPVHATEMVYYSAGTNRAGKAISASWRCPVADCRGQTIWIGDKR
jgi:hypothetical protein